MGNGGVGPVWRLAQSGAVALALVASTVVLAQPAASRARARTSQALYYETDTTTGGLAIDRLALVGAPASTQILTLPDVGVFGIAVARGDVYWVTETAPADRGAVMRATVGGQQVRPLVGGLPAPNSIVAVGGFVYWSDRTAIGRVALDGSHLQRRFLVLPQEPRGGVADGLASDGTHLYFSRCTDHAIGRVGLNGRGLALAYIPTGQSSCPQGIAIAAGHLYWTQLRSGHIGRVGLNGRGLDKEWLNIHSDEGPFQLAADPAEVYWTWGGFTTPAFTGRARTDRSHVERRFLANSIYPLALADG